MSCAHGICGSDAVSINGIPALACQKLVKDYDYTQEILIEPLKFFPIVKDLIVDMEPFFERIKSIHPNAPLQTLNCTLWKRNNCKLLKSEAESTTQSNAYCAVAAWLLAQLCWSRNNDFIGPAAILRAQKYIFDSRRTDAKERMQIMEKPYGIWGCKSYYMCTVVCPKKIKVTEAILKTKKKIIQELHPKSE